MSDPRNVRMGACRPLVGCVLVILAAALGSCDGRDGPTGPGESSPRLTVVIGTVGWTEGGSFTLFIDGVGYYDIGPNDQRTFDRLGRGPHEVRLMVRSDCRTDQGIRQINLTGDLEVHFDVRCFGFGQLDVIMETTGGAPYGGHWLVLEVGEWEVALAANGTTSVPLLGGQHLPEFHPAPNCTSSSGVGVVQVVPGETTEVRLQAACVPAGTLTAVLVPIGTDVPSAVVWDVIEAATGTGQRLLLPAGREKTVMLGAVDWTGSIVELPANCVPVTADPVPFTVVAEDTVRVEVGIDCTPYRGLLRVALTSNHPGVWLSVNRSCVTYVDLANGDCYPQLTPNGVTEQWWAPGTYAVHVGVFPPAGTVCSTIPAEPVTVVIRTAEVTDVSFDVSCGPDGG